MVNTNKALVYIEKHEDQLLMISCIDNLLKGAVGQAVQNMNLMFGIDEKSGLTTARGAVCGTLMATNISTSTEATP